MKATGTAATLVALWAGAATFAAIAPGGPAARSQAVSSAAVTGAVYGARLGADRAIWVRLRPDRRAIANLQIDWMAPASGCDKTVDSSLRQSTLYSGSENDHAIAIRGGRFVARYSSTYTYGGYALVEKVRLTGAFAGRRIDGTIEGTIAGTRRDGPGGFECRLALTRWSAVD